jgi:hypothetical protein
MASVSFWDALASISTFALLIVTGVYAYLTHKIAQATEENSWQVNRAIVSARLNVSQRALLGLVFENLGKTPATDLKIKLNHPVFQMINDKKDISEVPMIKNGLENFPPNFPVEIYLGTTFEWLNKEANRERFPTTFKITITYKTFGRILEETVIIEVINQLDSMGAPPDSADNFFRTFPDKHIRSLDKLSSKIDGLVDRAPPPIFKGRSWSDSFHEARSRSRHLGRWI